MHITEIRYLVPWYDFHYNNDIHHDGISYICNFYVVFYNKIRRLQCFEFFSADTANSGFLEKIHYLSNYIIKITREEMYIEEFSNQLCLD